MTPRKGGSAMVSVVALTSLPPGHGSRVLRAAGCGESRLRRRNDGAAQGGWRDLRVIESGRV